MSTDRARLGPPLLTRLGVGHLFAGHHAARTALFHPQVGLASTSVSTVPSSVNALPSDVGATTLARFVRSAPSGTSAGHLWRRS